MWAAFGGIPSESTCIESTPDLEEICKALCGFHARLALIVQGLDVDEVYAIGFSCCLSWFASADKADQIKMS